MKHQQYNSRCLAQSSASDHRSAMKEIARGQSLVTQLRAIVLPALQADERSELVAHMFQNILDCSSKAMAELQMHQARSTRRPDDDDVLVDDKKRVKKISSVDCKNMEGVTTAKSRHQHKRRRFDDSVSLETPVPHYDGRQWRKYGQKYINNTKHSRSYYRCTYRQEQGCKATKTVQQQDDSSGADHTLMYTVVYYGQHTCKDNDGANSSPDDSETHTTRSNSDSQSSTSSACTDPCDNQNQTSLHDNKPIDDKSEKLVTKDMYEPFDMTVFAPFDLDGWELDALLRFGA
ncbi:probable WRKY transcription factor 62 isoform X1 [Miscanthus floridulus]|uniref:probable WRKY transcription factor 62 isoform X1 n=2 Tax=Miscanthus floridulus TaxID=154761 RepID=UPI003458E09C